jgi:Skp family chaperone for outer membrane proteins
MGRPRELEDAKMVPIILDQETRKIVEMMKGDGGASSYIRKLIREQDPKASRHGEAKTLVLRKDLRAMEAELESYRRNEQASTKEQEEVLKYIAQGFEQYMEKNKRAEDPEARRNWLEARCKGSGISPAEFLSYQKRI